MILLKIINLECLINLLDVLPLIVRKLVSREIVVKGLSGRQAPKLQLLNRINPAVGIVTLFAKELHMFGKLPPHVVEVSVSILAILINQVVREFLQRRRHKLEGVNELETAHGDAHKLFGIQGNSLEVAFEVQGLAYLKGGSYEKVRVVIPEIVDDHREESLGIVIEIADLVSGASELPRDVVVVSNFDVALLILLLTYMTALGVSEVSLVLFRHGHGLVLLHILHALMG